jgi:NAD(P)-dependent dehydrogenase (short-subunit alcohol dehydrogenase family)/acyl carrier protein
LPALFGELLTAFKSGELRPLPTTVFQVEQTVEAFRFMAQAKHIGKIVVTRPLPWTESRSAQKKPYFRNDASYLITGGLRGLGLESARWMAREGARNLVLLGRLDPSANAMAVLNELTRSGVKVAIEKCDVSDEAQLAAVFERVSMSMPPIRGVVHAAGILDDGVLLKQSWPRFENVMAPKVQGAWNLHRLTSALDLDFMVYFSAAAAIIGASGQGNYAAANTFMDALAHKRKAMGLPALSINWGAWAEVGMAARLEAKDSQHLSNLGLQPIALEDGMKKLGEMIGLSRAQVIAMPVDWSRFHSRDGGQNSTALFDAVRVGPVSSKSAAAGASENNLVKKLATEPAVRRLAVLQSHVESVARRALGMAPGKSLDPQQPLHELGLDSLMSVELRNALAASLGRSLQATMLFDYPTIESLSLYLAKSVLLLEITNGPSDGDVDSAEVDSLKELENLTESEAEALLLAELDRAKVSSHD